MNQPMSKGSLASLQLLNEQKAMNKGVESAEPVKEVPLKVVQVLFNNDVYLPGGGREKYLSERHNLEYEISWKGSKGRLEIRNKKVANLVTWVPFVNCAYILVEEG